MKILVGIGCFLLFWASIGYGIDYHSAIAGCVGIGGVFIFMIYLISESD